MTQKHYIEFAAMIKSELDDINKYDHPEARVLQTTIIANRIANIFANDNPRFKRGLFMRACGLEG